MNMKKIAIKHVYGNVLRVDIPLTEIVRQMVDGQELPPTRQDFYPDTNMPVTIALDSTSKHYEYKASVSGNIAHFEDKGIIQPGAYNVTVQCFRNDDPFRYMVRDIIEIVDATADAGIEADIEFDAESYTLEGAVFVSYTGEGGDSVQSDWNENDPASPAYIKHKPDLEEYATKQELREVEEQIPAVPEGIVTDENYVHTDNNFTDADKTKVGSAITEETDPTVPSWAKQPNKPTYTAQEVGALPADTPIPTKTSDLTNDSGFLTEHQDISGKVDKIAGKGLSTNDYTDADKAKLAGLHNYDDTEVRNLIADNSVAVETKNAAANMTISADKLTVISGAVGTSAITLQVPNDNKAHVWDIMMSTDSSADITFAMSNGATILKPSGFSVAASKDVEISVIGVGNKYYLRYGEFAS